MKVLDFVLDRLRLYASTYRKLDRNERWGYIRDRFKVMAEIVSQRDLLRESTDEFYTQAVVEATTAAIRGYLPKRYRGSAVLFIASNRKISNKVDGRLHWQQLVEGGTTVYENPAKDSGDMLLDANLGTLVTKLNECLENTRA